MAGEGFEKLNGNLVCEKDQCTACGACVNICPKKCIEIRSNQYKEGIAFWDSDKCIKCGLCKKVCPNYNSLLLRIPISTYAGWQKKTVELVKCSSGGIATAIANYIVDKQGIVYGVASQKIYCKYVRATTRKDIEKLKGSKYVFARGDKQYSNIENDVLNGKNVLVVGTPCYIAGVRSYFINKKIEISKLFLVDFLCHGTVPMEYLEERLRDLERKYKFDEVCFRSNLIDENYYLTLKKQSKTVYRQKAEIDYYFLGFLKSISTKQCCAECRYRRKERSGDITLGDFIGLGKEIPFRITSPVMSPSLVLVNTEKGKNLLAEINNDICITERMLEEAVKGGPSLRKDNMQSHERENFRKYICTKTFKKAIYRSMGAELLKNRVKYTIKKIASKKR